MSAEELKIKGNKAFGEKKYAEAISLYTDALKLNPDMETSGALYSNRSASYVYLREFQKALDDAENCVRCRPTWEKGYFRRGVALQSMGKLDDARKAFQQHLQIKPDSSEVRDTLTDLNKEIHERNEKAIPSKQQDAESAKCIGNSLFSEGKYDRAAEFYTRAIELQKEDIPEKANFYANRAACYQQTHLYHEMVNDCNKAIAINPKHPKAFMRRAIAYEGMEKWVLALADYEQAQRLSPGIPSVSQGVLRCQRALRR